MSRAERKAAAQKRREEIRDVIVLGIRERMEENGMDLSEALQYGEDMIRLMITNKPQEKSLVLDGGRMARDLLQKIIDRARKEQR